MESLNQAWQNVIEFLASKMDTRTSLLSAIIDSAPFVLGDSSNAVRERLSLRYLEEFTGMACEKAPPTVAANTNSSDSAKMIDASHTCEEVLCSKVEAANDFGKANVGLNGGDHQQFILLKRATLKKTYIDLLKEKVLESSQPDFSYFKECNNLSEVWSHCVDTCNSHRDDHGIEKFVHNINNVSQRMEMLNLIRKYKNFNNQANTPLKCVMGATQKDCSSLQHLAEQNAMDDMKNRQNEFHKDKAEAFLGKISPEFHDVEKQLPKEKLSDFASPTFAPVDLNDSQSGDESHNPNVLHHDKLEVVDSDCDDVNLWEQCSMPLPSPAQGLCIKCGSNNNQLLNCHGEGCLIEIHERCLGPLASVEETGIFYCPSCFYKNARMMYEKAKRKAQIARRNFFAFYGVNPAIHDLKTKSPAKYLIKSEQVNVEHNMEVHSKFPCKETIEGCTYPDSFETSIKLNCEADQEHGSTSMTSEWQPVSGLGLTALDSLTHDLNAFTNDAVCVNNDTCEVSRDYLQSDEGKNLHTSVMDDEQISLQPNKISALNDEGRCDHGAKSKTLSSKVSVRFAKRKRRDNAVKYGAYHDVIECKRTDGPFFRVLRKRQNQLNRCSVIKQPSSRRPILIWRPEEEEILEEAMQKMYQNEDRNFPWIKILEYCRPVLHESRTPIDLKDKWRNMQKKKRIKSRS